jgi:muramidase (phage lysozyme)
MGGVLFKVVCLPRMASGVIAATALLSVGCGAGQSGSLPVNTSNAGGLAAPTRAVLDVIAHAEGTGTSYNFIFSYRKFSSFNDHPRQVVCSGGYCSDSAGRYQFLSTTWDETRRGAGLSNFQPVSQDKGAVFRMQSYRGVRDHNQNLTRAQFERLVFKLNREWASFPGSPYGQPTKSMSDLWGVYQKSLSVGAGGGA